MKAYTQPLALLFVAVTCICTKVVAQELELESFHEATNEVMTVRMQKTDLNGEICALVKVHLPVVGCTFKGNVVGTPVFNFNEYWVYMPKGSRQLQVNCPHCHTMMIDFVENGKQVQLQSKRVYELVLKVPEGLSIETSIYKDVCGEQDYKNRTYIASIVENTYKCLNDSTWDKLEELFPNSLPGTKNIGDFIDMLKTAGARGFSIKNTEVQMHGAKDDVYGVYLDLTYSSEQSSENIVKLFILLDFSDVNTVTYVVWTTSDEKKYSLDDLYMP